MIASFSNKFIFLKTRKTGGTSLEIVLSSWCSDGDVMTAISPDDEVMRRQVCQLEPVSYYDGQRVFNHMPAARVKQLFPDFWDEAFKFAVERHPYEKVISRTYWNIGRRGGDFDLEFDRELEETLNSGIFIDRDIYMIDGQIAVDEVIDHGAMWSRIAELAWDWGKALPDNLPRAKGHHRQDRRPAAEILSEQHKEKIRQIAAFEFDAYGYAT
jgi:hypothetical protein